MLSLVGAGSLRLFSAWTGGACAAMVTSGAVLPPSFEWDDVGRESGGVGPFPVFLTAMMPLERATGKIWAG